MSLNETEKKETDMFVKITRKIGGTTLLHCERAHWKGDNDESGAKRSDDVFLTTEPDNITHVIPPIGVEVYFMNDQGKTVDALHWPS